MQVAAQTMRTMSLVCGGSCAVRHELYALRKCCSFSDVRLHSTFHGGAPSFAERTP